MKLIPYVALTGLGGVVLLVWARRLRSRRLHTLLTQQPPTGEVVAQLLECWAKLSTSNDSRLKFKVADALCKAYLHSGQLEVAGQYTQAKLQLAHQLGDISLQIQLTGELASCHFALECYDEALACYTQQLDDARAHYMCAEEVLALLGCGVCYFTLGALKVAAECYVAASVRLNTIPHDDVKHRFLGSTDLLFPISRSNLKMITLPQPYLSRFFCTKAIPARGCSRALFPKACN
eukprot:NODE_3956_length_868_cov_81.960864_g3801_i0.p1 GENE.NODE_3956_length_868_cov_81.960864_g3801_i0~~NODE_3956_length_868_cov_81.960864_g3801_i0.p1  ORF type:complete len:265 (-),score=64.97 NODE_3956_length_868_cov_81.960864_g3801_i0:73-777(-)